MKRIELKNGWIVVEDTKEGIKAVIRSSYVKEIKLKENNLILIKMAYGEEEVIFSDSEERAKAFNKLVSAIVLK